MDKSLDELIANKPRTGRRGAPRRRAAPTGRSAVLGKQAPAPVQRTRAVAAVAAKVQPTVPAEKIIVSGLPLDVNEAQVKDLFASTIGPVREVALTYNAQGKSKGTATVLFSRKGDGSKAYQQYNNRLIDGTAIIEEGPNIDGGIRKDKLDFSKTWQGTETKPGDIDQPMKIEIIVDPIRAVPLASRVAPAAVAGKEAAAQRNGGGPVRVGRRRGGTGGRPAGAARPPKAAPKTAADLDAEMEDYTAAASNPAAAPAS